MAKYEIVATGDGAVVGTLETDLAPHMLLEGERTGRYQYRSPDAPVPGKDSEEQAETSPVEATGSATGVSDPITA